MSEINERWKRDHSKVIRLTSAGAASSGACWLISFYASVPAVFGASVHEAWFAFASIVTFIGAVGLTIGTGVGISALVTDDPPLPGQNY